MTDETDHKIDETVVRRERFSGGPAREFLSSLAADERIFEADLAVDRAHVLMLAEQSIVTEDDAGAILAALADIEAAGHEALPDAEDVHEAIETAVIERVGQAGGRMHTARSRNDEVATCLRYQLRADVIEAIETVVDARSALLDVAGERTETILPGYTHLQPAQPTTVAHWLCSYEEALARDTERFLAAYERINRSPLGAAAFGGTSFDVDREYTAALLGFDGLVENTMDAVSARDFLVETTAAAAGLGVTLSGLAEDGILFAHRGYLDLADEYASTSSIMPQKKNPDTLELVRGRTGDATAGLDGLLTALKGLPRAYNRDLQRASHHAFEGIESVTEATEVAVGAISTADWNEAALHSAAREGFSTATGVADLLAAAGVPFRTAHELVARAGEAVERDGGTSNADETNERPDVETLDAVATDVLGEPLSAFVEVDDLQRVLDPEGSVTMRDSRGGPAAGAMSAHLDRAHTTLDEHRATLVNHYEALENAHQERETAVSHYV
jgi:argininosuccinate lyase